MTATWRKVNVNARCRFKVTEQHRAVFEKRLVETFGSGELSRMRLNGQAWTLSTDAEGYHSTMLWSYMHDFGPEMQIGSDFTTDNLEIEIEEEPPF